MTGTRATADPVADGAGRAAADAARVSGVVVRELTEIRELTEVVGLLAAIWGRPANPPMTIELLRAFTKAGNYVAGAFDADRLVGACVGFFHDPADGALHSHIAGVSAEAAGRRIGFALKLHQRAWTLRRGVSEIAWTFDPLVARNAYFNLTKLAGRAVDYLPDFYGPMADAINGAEDSDRLLVRWRLRDHGVVLASTGHRTGAVVADELAAGAVVALGIAGDGRPRAGGLDGTTSLVAVPPDVEKLRVSDPGLARHWRAAVREALTGLAARGGRIDGFDRAGWYLVRR
ncbi:GNAT family N-acetyltransferase [Amycolatopsis sp. NPDC051106]|uniref:GNAT family N-acetyltransferase n=1 Tax=unclassified Amycolatopsis TaxID=2618356 RepID=UPI00344265DB